MYKYWNNSAGFISHVWKVMSMPYVSSNWSYVLILALIVLIRQYRFGIHAFSIQVFCCFALTCLAWVYWSWWKLFIWDYLIALSDGLYVSTRWVDCSTGGEWLKLDIVWCIASWWDLVGLNEGNRVFNSQFCFLYFTRIFWVLLLQNL